MRRGLLRLLVALVGLVAVALAYLLIANQAAEEGKTGRDALNQRARRARPR